MRRIRQCDFASLLKVFDQENAEKDQRIRKQSGEIDKWPRDRFGEADIHFKGEWYEYEFNQADLTRIRLHLNKDFAIPVEGMTLQDAETNFLNSAWFKAGGAGQLPLNTHLWLASKWFESAWEHKQMLHPDGCFILLDGIHRVLAWAHSRRSSVLVFIAGNPEESVPSLNATI